MKWIAMLFSAAVLSAQPAGLKLGAGAAVITPFLDSPMAGYYYPRTADGLHDDLHAKALVLESGAARIALVAIDAVAVSREAVEDARRRITNKWGIPADHILISATHSHTGPVLTPEYSASLARWIADAVTTAESRKEPARLLVATEQEASLPHIRRYRMKDGSVRTNPGFLNPDVVEPVGQIDPTVGVLVGENSRGEPLITWVNYAMHQDTVGGTLISADYAYFLGRFLSRFRGPDTLTLFTIAAAGNVNHWDVRRAGPQRGFDEARRIGEVLGRAVVKACTHLSPVAEPRIRAASEMISLPVESVTAQQVEAARRLLATPPPPNVDFTLDRVEASKIMRVHRREGKPISTEVQVLAVGDVAFVGVPGELFVELGRRIKQASPFAHTFIVELANDGIGYIPTREAFAQGGYEPTSSPLAPGGGEQIADTAIRLVKSLAAR